MRERVLLGISDGIDSSVSTMLLQDKEYEVVGITFLVSEQEVVNRSCLADANTLARMLQIEHHISNL